MKRTLTSLLSICITICLFITAVAASTDPNSFLFGNKEITILDDSINYSKMQAIAAFVADEHSHDNTNTTYAISCLLGHDIAESMVFEVEHCVYDTAPRCLEKEYHVTYCTRSTCDYMVKDLLYEAWIFCCE
ncbi:MAG: hypothetical protein IJZ89_01845 [Clostridia bacterium]|nr:hypothetical protein [Clostridia bacterium]